MSQPRQPSRDVRRARELNVNMREIHLVEVKYCEDTRPGHQLEASGEQHEVLCKRLKAKKLSLNFFLKKSSFTPFFLVWEALFVPHTL